MDTDAVLAVVTCLAQRGFSVRPFLAASRAFTTDKQLWEALLHSAPFRHRYGGGGRTRLMHAASVGSLQRLRFLLACGADVHAVSGDGLTAVLLAAQGNFPDVISELASRGAGLEAPAGTLRGTGVPLDGFSPLLAAARLGHEAAARELLSRGALLDAGLRTNGKTPLALAAERGHGALCRMLIEEFQAGGREAALRAAIQHGKADTACELLALGAAG